MTRTTTTTTTTTTMATTTNGARARKMRRPVMRGRFAAMTFVGVAATVAGASRGVAQPSEAAGPDGEDYTQTQTRPALQERPRALPSEGPVSSWQSLPLAVALETRTTWPPGADQRLVGERSTVSAGVSLQGDIVRTDKGLVLRLDLGWVTRTTSSIEADSGLSETLATNQLFLGASLRYQLWRWLAPFARVSGGPGWDAVTVVDLHDREAFMQGAAGGGLFLRTPGISLTRNGAGPYFGLLGQVEAGYALATSSDFAMHASSTSAANNPIPTPAVPLGHVGRSSPYLRVSLGLGF
ncbi:MAG: hypothetical protein ABSB49_20770 [Polyangia bacterium]